VASALGGIGLPQLEQVIKVSVDVFSTMTNILVIASVIARLPYILCVSVFATLLFQLSANIEEGYFWA
jgi:hypothetical protein